MGEVPGIEGDPRDAGRRGRNWLGYYGFVEIADIEPWCVIDSLTYGVGTRVWYAPGGGRREVGIRPLWPDAAKIRDFADFYEGLTQDIAKNGVKVPVLLWRINGKLYCRYGASRLWVLNKLGRPSVPAIICDFGCNPDDWSPSAYVPLDTPAKVLNCLGLIAAVGTFEVSHERIDIHNVVPL